MFLISCLSSLQVRVQFRSQYFNFWFIIINRHYFTHKIPVSNKQSNEEYFLSKQDVFRDWVIKSDSEITWTKRTTREKYHSFYRETEIRTQQYNDSSSSSHICSNVNKQFYISHIILRFSKKQSRKYQLKCFRDQNLSLWSE